MPADYCALSRKKSGTLDKVNVKMIGATAEAIDKAEERESFRETMKHIDVSVER